MRYFKNTIGLFCFTPDSDLVTALVYVYRNKAWTSMDVHMEIFRGSLLTFEELSEKDQQRVIEKSLV